MPKKYYAVRIGRQTGIFETLKEFNNSVSGYPSSKGKSFKKLEDAEKYFKSTNSNEPVENKTYLEKEVKRLKKEKINIGSTVEAPSYKNEIWNKYNAMEDVMKKVKNGAIAYTDGSYNHDTGKYGYAAIYFSCKSAIPIIISGQRKDNKLKSVAGEFKAVEKAIEKAIEEKRNWIEIRYDCECVKYYSAEEAKIKNNIQEFKQYQNKIKKYSKNIIIIFSKVKAHDGDIFNTEADRHARAACKTKK
jgi:ribonuclease HI